MPSDFETNSIEQKFIMLSIVLLLSSNGLANLFSGSEFVIDRSGSSPIARIVVLIAYLICMLFATRNWTSFIVTMRRAWLLWPLVILSILSISWASLPELTIRRSIALMLTTAYGVYIASRINMAEMLYLQAKMFAILIMINLFVILILPEHGIHHSEHFGAWRGFFSHKNTFGMMMLFASLIYFILAMQADHLQKIYWLGFIVSGILLIKSHSQTSFLTLCITCSCTPFVRAIRWPGFLSKAFYISGFLFTAFFSYTLAINIERVMILLGRDMTFTGRTEVWQYGLAMIQEKPWIGYGFGSKWIHESWGFIPAWHTQLKDTVELHNGYLELLAQLGGVGMLLFGILFIFIFIRSVLLVGRSKTVVAYWPLYYLIFFSVYNLFERTILEQNNFIWIMFVMLCVWLTSPLPEKATIN